MCGPRTTARARWELNMSATPPEVASMTQLLSLDDIFLPPIVDYVCARASIKDAEFGPGLQYNSAFMQNFMLTITGKDAGEKEQNPDAALPPVSNR